MSNKIAAFKKSVLSVKESVINAFVYVCLYPNLATFLIEEGDKYVVIQDYPEAYKSLLEQFKASSSCICAYSGLHVFLNLTVLSRYKKDETSIIEELKSKLSEDLYDICFKGRDSLDSNIWISIGTVASDVYRSFIDKAAREYVNADFFDPLLKLTLPK